MLQDSFEQGIVYFKAGKYDEARECWERAADFGNAGSMFCLGLLNLHEKYRNLDKAKYWLTMADRAGHKNAKKQMELIENNGNDFKYIDTYFGTTSSKNETINSPIITFGGYDWYVIKEENGKRLCLSKNIVDIRPYNRLAEHTSWETCDIRKWLNSTLLDSFSEKEQKRISLSRLVNHNNPVFNTSGGNDTEDRLFLLSLSEVIEIFKLDIQDYVDDNLVSTRTRNHELASYVSMNERRLKEASSESGIDYQLIQGQTIGWWLRTPGASENKAVRVNCFGVLRIHGREVNRNLVGIRPAFWMGE